MWDYDSMHARERVRGLPEASCAASTTATLNDNTASATAAKRKVTPIGLFTSCTRNA